MPDCLNVLMRYRPEQICPFMIQELYDYGHSEIKNATQPFIPECHLLVSASGMG